MASLPRLSKAATERGRSWLVCVLLAGVGGPSCGSDCEYLGPEGVLLCGAPRVSAAFVAEASDMPVVEGTVDGKPVWLLVDTGASGAIISATLLGRASQRWTPVSLCIGALCIVGIPAWAEDTVFSSPEPRKINGLIGMEALQHLLVEIDRGRTLTLVRGRATCAGSTHELTFDDDGRPFLSASIDGTGLGRILLDTGALYTLLSQASAAGAPYLMDSAVPTGGCSIAGCSDTGNFTSTARRFCVDATCLDAVAVKYPVWDAVGGSFLRRLRTQIDFERKSLRFCDQ